MEYNVSHLILFAGLRVEFAGPPENLQAGTRGAKLQYVRATSPPFLSRAVASTFTEIHRRGRVAYKSKGNKSNAYAPCACGSVSASV